ncbi:hypothetical protein [Elizabethkingia anophelis]|uniref:hypothetical protein n=1 Tax=Elizabethkingia anophelis TaxID=1117645 RepID=UPI00378703FC
MNSNNSNAQDNQYYKNSDSHSSKIDSFNTKYNLEEIPLEELDEIGLLKRVIISADKGWDLLDLALPRFSEFNYNCANLLAQIQEIESYSNTISVMLEQDKKSREEFLNSIPKESPLVIPPEHLESMNNFTRSTGSVKQMHNGMLGVYGLAILFVSICGYIGIKNYEIGIKTKEEHREEFIQELKDNGNTVVPEKDLSELRKNTKLIQQWVKKYPKESDSFMKFREGYDSHVE